MEIRAVPVVAPQPVAIPPPPPPKPRSQSKNLAKNSSGDWGGWCVTYAKKVTGKYGTWGDGGRKLSLTKEPQVGAVVVFNYTHVAVIDVIEGDRMKISESNYEKSMRISSRWISVNDPTIRGFHIP